MSGISQNQLMLLSLVSSGLFQVPAVIPAQAGWRAVLEEAELQAVVPIAFPAARPHLSGEDLSLWRRASEHIVARNLRVEWEHAHLHRLMAAREIPYVALKGAASADYYPEPALRTMGDVDFLVSPARMEEAGKALESAGFVPVEDTEHAFHTAYHREVSGCPRSVWELHWAPGGMPDGQAGRVLRQMLSDVLDRAEERAGPGGVYMVPCAFHHGLILLLHTAHHMINTGVGLRHLCDWAVFADSLSDEAFTGIFEEKLKAAGLWRFARLLTAVSARYLGSRERPWAAGAEDKLLEEILLDIFAGGNFGGKDPERINEAKLMTNRSRGTVDDTGFLRQLCYAMNDKARDGLPAAKRHPVLLPAGWLYVGGRHLLRMLTGKRPKIHINKMVRGAAERKNIYREFRLFQAE